VTAWCKFIRHICLHTASFVYISEVNVRFIYTTWLLGARLSAIFVYILLRLFTYQRLKLGLFTPRDRQRQGRPPPMFTCVVIRLLTPPLTLFASRELWRDESGRSLQNCTLSTAVNIQTHMFISVVSLLQLYSILCALASLWCSEPCPDCNYTVDTECHILL